jgi:Uma2 family endonuclease
MTDPAYSEKYTRQDFQHWDGNWELIEGSPYAMSPSPTFHHQYVNLKIARQLDEQLESCTQCHAVIETDVELSQDTVVRPDSMVICYEPEEQLTRAPELVFEVISPSTARRDELLKFELYQTEGVKYYVLTYPDSRKAKVFHLIEGKYRKLGDYSAETITFQLSACQIDFDFNFIWRK